MSQKRNICFRTEIRRNRRDGAESETATLVGIAARTGVRYQVLDFEEEIAPGAFRKVLEQKGTDVVALVNHDYSQVLGRESNDTLELRETDDGLEASIDLNLETTSGRDVLALVERGDITQMSFGFWLTRHGQEWSKDGKVRTITEISELDDVSVVTRPANPETSVSVGRSYELDDDGRELRAAAQGPDKASRMAIEREAQDQAALRAGLTPSSAID